MTCHRAIIITWLISSLPASAFAFAPVEAGLTENPPTTPKATQGNVVVLSFATHGRAMIREDGSFAFLGRYPPATVPPTAPQLWAAKGSADLIPWAVAEARAYLVQSTGGVVDPGSLVNTHADMVGNAVVVHFDQYTSSVRLQGVAAIVVVGTSGVRYARHNLVAPPQVSSSARIAASRAQEVALEHVLASVEEASLRGDPEKVVLFDEAQLAQLVWRVEVDTRVPYGWWAIYVSADDASVIAGEKLSFDGVEGTVRFDLEPDCQGDPPVLLEMPHVQWNSGEYTGADGHFSANSTPSDAEVELDGPYFTIRDRQYSLGGPWTLPLQPSPAHNDLEITDARLAQADAFYYASVVRLWVLANTSGSSSQIRWTNTDVEININLNDTCNAYYDGSINFFRAGGGCNNTARIAAIVYHEYGHGVHHHSGRYLDGQVSEGIADFTAATIRNDPDMNGIFDCDSAFRSCDNDVTYCRSGCDVGPRSEVHEAGQVMCAVLWEFRELMVARYGYDQGVAHTDRIFLKFLTLVGDMDSAYDAAIAADDDNDDDPVNGTTHSCQLNRAFADDAPGGTDHFPQLDGMVPSIPSAKLTHDAPGQIDPAAASTLLLDFDFELDTECLSTVGPPQVNATLVFQLPGQDEQEIDLQTSGANFYTASIDGLQQPAVVSYYARFEVEGQEFFYPAQPNNVPSMFAASDGPVYRQSVYFGEQETIFFDDLEAALSGYAVTTENADGNDDSLSDWQHGPPSSKAGGPSAAHSGQNVWGTNLDGAYDADRVSTLELGPLSTRGYSQVHLQLWRQLFNADVVRIEINGQTVYEQRAVDFEWKDPEWIFHDIDISSYADDTEEVRIRFIVDDALDNDDELAGLYIDDLHLLGTPIPTEQETDDASVSPWVNVVNCTAVGGMPSSVAWLIGIAVLQRIRRRRSQ